jgi:hypothetical protein
MIDWIRARLRDPRGCKCVPKTVLREQPAWNPGRTLYGYGVGVTVRAHMSPCQLADEVLEAHVVRIR